MSTPSEVPSNDCSMSCTAIPLPPSTTCTKPARISAARCSEAPVWMTTGPGYDHHLAAAFADPFKFPSDLADHQFDFALAADPGAHEREFRGRRCADPAFLAGFALAHSLNSINSYDHPIAAPKIAHQADGRSRLGRVGTIDDDASVHPLTGDSHPFAIRAVLPSGRSW